MAAGSGLNQTAMNTLLRQQASRGLGQSGISTAVRAGMLGQQSNNALQQAFGQAMGLAGQRASVWSQQPFYQAPNYWMGNALGAGVSGLTNGLALYGGRNQQPNQQSPYTGPGWGLPTYGNPVLQ
jgi:hypothetical protein